MDTCVDLTNSVGKTTTAMIRVSSVTSSGLNDLIWVFNGNATKTGVPANLQVFIGAWQNPTACVQTNATTLTCTYASGTSGGGQPWAISLVVTNVMQAYSISVPQTGTVVNGG